MTSNARFSLNAVYSLGLPCLPSDRGYWRWRYMVLDKHSPSGRR